MRIPLVAAAIVIVLSVVALFGPLAAARGTHIELQAGPFAPDSSGRVQYTVHSGVLSGTLRADDLPTLGVHSFYVFWFVRTDTGDKAFLGPVVNEDSIFFPSSGDGRLRFNAPTFTAGPAVGSPISLGSTGNNFFVLIAENNIDTFMPHPISTPPSSFALTATF